MNAKELASLLVKNQPAFHLEPWWFCGPAKLAEIGDLKIKTKIGQRLFYVDRILEVTSLKNLKELEELFINIHNASNDSNSSFISIEHKERLLELMIDILSLPEEEMNKLTMLKIEHNELSQPICHITLIKKKTSAKKKNVKSKLPTEEWVVGMSKAINSLYINANLILNVTELNMDDLEPKTRQSIRRLEKSISKFYKVANS
jgi:hypothetical protein